MHRILVIRIDFLGDMACTTAFLHALKQRWPQAEVHVLANKINRAVLERNPDVAAVHTYVYSKQCERNDRAGKVNALLDRLRLVLRLRRFAFDLVIVPNGGMHKNSMQFARQLRAKAYRWHDAETQFDDRQAEHAAHRPMRHEALSGFALMPELAPVAPDALRLRVYPDAALQAKWETELAPKRGPRVGLFVSNKAEQRRWAAQKWHRLAEAMAERADVVIFHDPSDSRTFESIAPGLARVLSPPTVGDLIAAMSVLDLVISADSAPVHFASALGVPVVAMFEDRPEKYLRWYPLGIPHVLLRAGPKVDDISAAQVAAAARSLLDECVVAMP
ncbi:MAG: lipopolysaccharide heptosyltransferase family protein [Paraburkholderia sp.]|nr:MAG: lipopolysaccharide heptosyltransferase family protein [Paraburkholderia sp.]